MAIEDLLAGDVITIKRRPRINPPVAGSGNQDTSGAIGVNNYQVIFTGVNARVEDLNAHDTLAYAVRGMVIDSRIFTEQVGLAKMDVIVTSDGRTKLIEGVKYHRAMGSLPDYYECLTSEYRPGV